MSAPSISGNLKSPFFPQKIEEDNEPVWRKKSDRKDRNDDDNNDSDDDDDDENEQEEAPAEIQSLLMPMRR